MEPNFKSKLRQKVLLDIIQAIRETPGGLSRSMMIKKFGFCDTSAKDYTIVLHNAGILKRAKGEGKYPQFMYTIAMDNGAIADFLNSDAMMKPRQVPPKKKPLEQRLVSDPTRHFHVAAEDEPVPVRIPNRRIPPRDPLIAALFGQAVAA